MKPTRTRSPAPSTERLLRAVDAAAAAVARTNPLRVSLVVIRVPPALHNKVAPHDADHETPLPSRPRCAASRAERERRPDPGGPARLRGPPVSRALQVRRAGGGSSHAPQ